ncbi:MAG: amidohydrolase family protein [Myxococcota bacterium]
MKQRLSESKYISRDENGAYRISENVGPIVDVHSHLALTYVPTGRIDLHADAVAQLYLDPELPFDIEEYMNTNFDDGSMKEMRHDLSVGSLTKDGMRATHTGPALTRSMDELGIERSVILAIDLPFSQTNTEGYLTVAGDHDKLIAAAAIHPMAPGAIASLRRAVERGARAYKMHPAVQQMRPDHPKAMAMYEVCGELGIPVVWHCGPVGIVGARADRRCYVKHYWQPVHDLPKTKFILGHSGALQYQMAVKLPNMYENVFVELSCQGLRAMREIIASVPKERILNGSDWPFYHQGVSVLKILHATEGNEDLRHQILWKNAAKLFQLAS